MIVLAELDLASARFRTPEGRRALEQLRVLSPEFAARAADHDASGAFPVDNIARLRAAGLLALQVSKEHGGTGLSADEYCVAIAQMAAGDASTALAYNMHSAALVSLSVLGAPEQKSRWFDRVVRLGAVIAALGSEPNLKPFQDGALPRTRLTRTAGGFLLNGLKSYSSFGPHADYLYVVARCDDGLGFAFVEAHSPGISRRDDWNVMSMRSTMSVTTEFKDVFVEEADVIIQPNLVAAMLLEVEFALGYGPIYLACACAAADCAIVDLPVRTSSRGSGLASADELLLAEEVGRMITMARPAWLTCLDATRAGKIGEFSRARAVVISKAVACEAACRIAEHALRLRGGRGLVVSDPVGRAFRDVQAGQVMAFSPQLARSMIGRLAVGLAPDHIRATSRQNDE